ncbi:hypothetical protein FH972_024640 [Carpinus fangiana]|uniref:CTLH domain-containing protein n=1 Tax=Carpinus fangiana TaxID=176857 RepID=A0A5N6KZG9_9ROSI|nr:hypothetical protein FH972_024640 [Carpinus fangiana]
MRGEVQDAPSHPASGLRGGIVPAKTGALNGSSPNGHSAANGNATNGAAANGASQASAPTTFYGHDREELTRILIQGLGDLGYQGAANALSRESGFEVETSHAAAFRLAVLEGNWTEAEALVQGTGPESDTPTPGLLLAAGASREEMLFLLRQQKYLELVEKRDIGQALMVLRAELQPLRRNERQLHALSSLIMVQSSDDLRSQARWDGAAGESRKDLLSILSRSISPSAMIPEHRLAELVNKVKENEMACCEYHNTTKWPSLYTDHRCSRDDFPLDLQIELKQHKDEVWVIKFSHDGTRLATASKDQTVKIYEMNQFSVVHTLKEHSAPVAFVAWSPDDTKIITCSQDKSAKLWDTKTGICLQTIHWHSEPVTSAAWAPDGKSYVTGSLDQSRPLTIWDAAGYDLRPLHSFECSGCRVQDVTIATMTPPASSIRSAMPYEYDSVLPVRLVVSCTDRSVHIYDYHRREKISHIQLDHEITCLNLSRDGQEMLINLNCGELWALGVDSGEVIQKYKGQKQSQFVIRGCYGGASEGVVVSGGEDSKICLWHRHSAKMIESIDAHSSGCVNSVAWNMAQPRMWASAGDDHTVRIWANPVPDAIRASRDTESVVWGSANAGSSSSHNAPSIPQWSSTGARGQ